MKRILTVLLIAVLLLTPFWSAQADTAYVTGDELLTGEEQASLSARAAEIYEAHGVALYFFYDTGIADLVPYVKAFPETVPEENVLVLGFNTEYYSFAKKGAVATAAFPDSVCADLRNVLIGSGSAVEKVLAYLNAAEDVLVAYTEADDVPAASPVSGETDDVPSYIALTAGGKPTLVDREQLLSAVEAQALSEKLVEIGNASLCDVVIVTVPSLGSKTSEAYADDFFDYNGYGYGAVPDATGMTVNGDGILLLLSMENRDFAISTSGYGITAFTDYGIQTYLEDAFLPYLSDNRFNDGLNAFADACGELLKMAREGVPYDCLHIYAADGSITSAQLEAFESRARQLAGENDLGVYFVQTNAVADMNAYLSEFLYRRVSESSAIVCGVGADGVASIQITGSTARRLFSGRAPEALCSAVQTSLDGNSLYGAIDAFLRGCTTTVEQRFIRSDALTDAQTVSLNEAAAELVRTHGVGVYFVESDSDEDASAFVSRFLSESVAEGSAIVFGKTASGQSLKVGGYAAEQTFTARDLKRMEQKLSPYLAANDLNGAVETYLTRVEKVLTRTPFNWLALGIAVVVGVLLGRIPVNSMKRQLTDVSKQKDADKYLEPSSYAVTQNSDVLLGTNVMRSVHVVAESSSSGSRPSGGGGGFHGGSSTHTSSSGGTHGGHSGKF